LRPETGGFGRRDETGNLQPEVKEEEDLGAEIRGLNGK
jgi:hypothetical protein